MADLIGDDTPSTFSAHPDLPPPIVALLTDRHRDARERGDATMADVLARLAASEAARELWRQMQRTNRRTGAYLYPTVLVDLWRDPSTRRDLQRLLRKHPAIQEGRVTRQRVGVWFRSMASHERRERAFLMTALLERLAELATRPNEGMRDEIARRRRSFADERRAATVLRERGLMEQAAEHTGRALTHLCCAHNLARDWTPDADELIRAVHGALSWQIGFLGYGITAGLVAAALNRPISRRQARYAVQIFRRIVR